MHGGAFVQGDDEHAGLAREGAAHLDRFAEQVEVDPRPGGSYRFWGRYTLWTETAELADQVLTAFEPDRELGYSWTWDGSPTRVGLQLVQSNGSVELALEHRWHWAFYAFREDTWPGMDYEVGPGPLPTAYWAAQERGERPQPPRHDNPLLTPLREGIERTAAPG